MTNQENKKEISMFDCGGKIAIAFLKEDGTADEIVIVSEQNIRKLTNFYFEKFLDWTDTIIKNKKMIKFVIGWLAIVVGMSLFYELLWRLWLLALKGG